MRFIEIPALITEDIEDPDIVYIRDDILASIDGTTLTIDGDSKVSGEVTITLTGDVNINAVSTSNLRTPSIHKITIKTNGTGNFTYVPNAGVTASSVSTTTKTGSDLEILLITTSGGDTYVDFDMADYTSPAVYTSNALTGFNVSELTSAYGATAKLYKPDGTLLTTVNSATTGSGVNFGYTESLPGDVEYKLEVTDDLGRKSTYNLPRKWINYAMGTTSTPGFQKFRLEGIDDDYTTTVMFPSLGSSSTAKVYRTSDHGYMGINFKIQGRDDPSGAWTDIANADENDDVLAFGNYKYHRVWVKPTAKATTTVSSSNVVTLTLTDFTEENVTTSFTGADPYDINESTNTYVFEETTKIGTVPFTVTLGSETYTNAVSATTEGTAYDYVTLAFANPTLSLTTSNVTISSAKLYKDDVLFHTYGTESNVVLRTDQTGTYQAVVNDVYYSNRVVPDFTTTRSVSAPQLEFDGYNRLNLSNITPTSTTLGVPDGTTRDLTTQSNVYIYEPGTYTANVQTSETFAYLSNVVTSQPSQNPTDVGPTFTFDEYNRLAISNLTQTSSTLEYGSNTYDTNTASNVYVTDAGEYILEAKDANTFVMSNVYVGAVSQHPSDVVPTLTFDGYNKLTIDNVDTVETATIKKDGAAFATTTSNTVYIRDTGTYTAEVKGSGAYAIELSNVVTGSVVPDNGWIFDETTSIGLASEILGFSVSISGDLGIVGSRDDNVVYFIKRVGTTWFEDLKISESNRFGWSVGISGNYAVVGSSSSNTITIYKYNGTTWNQIFSQTHSSYADGVAIDGDNIITGRRYSESQSILSRVTDTSWTRTSLTENSYIGEYIGHIVAISGVYAMSGIPDYQSSKGGVAVYYWDGTSWDNTQILQSTGVAANDLFGSSVSIDGDYAVIGATGVGTGGKAYIFVRSGTSWSQQYILESTDTLSGDDFGWSVSISGDTVVVGSIYHDVNGVNNVGALYIYERNGTNWDFVTKKIDSTANQNTYLAWSVSISGDYILSGTHSQGNSVYPYGKGPVGPNITYDNYNKITLNQLNYEDTATVSDPNGSIHEIGTAKTMYVKDIGDYVFKISGTDKYVESNVYVSSVDLAGAPTKPIDFDGYNKLTLIDAGSNVSANVTYFSNTYELGSANVLYINGAGTYDLEMSGSNVFALSSNVVGTVSQHPTDVVPSLTFDNYNKLTLENFTTSESDTRTATLTDPNGNTYSLGQTQNDIYIEDTGEYILEVTNSDQSAVVKKNVGTIDNIVPESTITYPVYKATSDTQPSSYYTAAASQNKRYNDGVVTMDFFNYYNGALDDQWRIFDGITNQNGQYNIQGLFSFQWNNNVVKKVMKMRIYGTAPSTGGTSFKTQIKATSSDSWTTLNTYDRTTDYTNDAWNEFPINQEVNACRLNFDGFSYGASYWHHVHEFEAVAIDDSVPPPPSLTFDNYSKLSINNLTPTSSRLTYGSNTYEIGTASNVYIEHGGTYKMATGDANTFALVSNVVGAIATGKFDPLDTTSDYSILGSAFTPSTTSDTQSTTSLSNDGTRVLVDNETGYFIQVYEYSSGSWTQLGSDINYGTSSTSSRISGDGNRVCVGISSSNQVKVYEYSSGSWSQIGTTITGSNGFGTDTSLNYDGTRLMVGASGDYNTRGNQTVWQESGGNWTQLGSTLYCNHNSYPHSLCGGNVDINNDGTVVCAGGYKGHSQDKGCLHVWKYNGSSWTQSFFSEGGNDHHSNYCRLSGDGKVVMYSHDRWNEPRGRVNFYENTSGASWSQIGGYLEDKKLGDLSNDGKTVVVGKSDASIDSQVYRFDGSAWVQLGSNLEHTSTTLSISSDGSTVAIGNSTSGANKVSVYKGTTPSPSLTYDTSNKLSIENLTPTSTTLTDPNGSSFDIGTASNVYIRDSGTYSIASKDANTFLLASNTVTGTPTGTTYTLETITNIGLNKHIDSASGHLGSATYGAQDDSEHNDLNFTTTILTNGYPTDLTTYGQNIARTSQTLQNGQWHSSSATGTGGTTSPYFRINLENDCYVDNIILHRTDGTDGITDTYGSTRFTNVRFQLLDSNEVQVKEVNVGTFSLDSYKTGICQVSGIRYVKVVTDSSTGYTHYDEIRINGYIMNVTATTPSQTYDTTKTITVKNVPSTLTDVVGKIYKGSTAYTIHATTSSSNVIIENAGTYVSVFTTATQAFLTNAIDATQPTITSDDTTIEDEGFIPGSTAVPDETTTDAPSVTLDATDTTVTEPTLDLDFTTQLPRTLKRYNGVTNSSIGARFNRRESRKKRIEKRISIPTSFSAELTANNASSPTTLTVTVANSKFVINGDETPTLGFIRGETYTFDQSDASNSGHPLVLATSADGATQYTTGWTTTPSSDYIPGVSGAQGTFIVPYDIPDTIYYKCSNHNNMGGEIHTTFGNAFSLGDFTVAANTHVSGEYTLATNYDGTTSNLYVNGFLITQTTPSPAISAGVKDFILGKEFDGYVKNFKFWNYAKRFFVTIIAFHHDTFANSGDPYNDGSVTVAAANGHVFSDTDTSISYTWGTLGSANYNNDNTTYTWTPTLTVTAKVLMVAGGGGGGNSDNINGGGVVVLVMVVQVVVLLEMERVVLVQRVRVTQVVMVIVAVVMIKVVPVVVVLVVVVRVQMVQMVQTVVWV
jgi:hypothetical protein